MDSDSTYVKKRPGNQKKSMGEKLSYAESVKFVREHLQLDKCESLTRKDKYKLLCEITRRLHEHSPFHNFFLLAQEPEKRRKPNWEEIKSQMLSGAGGLCYPRNLFTFYLLRALGFDVKIVLSAVEDYGYINHIALLVSNVQTNDDMYLADVGLGLPNFTPVDLNFGLETSAITESIFTFKYIQKDGKIIRMHRDETSGDEKSFVYKLFYEMKLDTFEPHQIEKYVDDIYEIPESCLMHKMLCCFQYTSGKLTLIRNNSAIVETNRGVEKKRLKNLEDLERCTLKYFPELDQSVVKEAIKNWNLEAERNGKMFES